MKLLWLAPAVATALLALGGASASAVSAVPTVLEANCSGTFAIRPSYIVFTCDGSAATGGSRTGKRTSWGHFGHIRWLKWTAREAVGVAQDWSKDWKCRAGSEACSVWYEREGNVYRLTLTRPVNGRFTAVSVPGGVFLSHLDPVTDLGITYYLWR